MGLSDVFRDAAQMRQEHAFDALRNREEEANLLAWQRVAEIASSLMENKNGQARSLGRELQQLAYAHTSISGELGFDSEGAGLTAVSSGMVMETDTFSLDDLEEATVPSMPEAQPLDTHVVPEMIDPPLRPMATDVATFKHVCDGRDGKLCLFEDADGHLVVVRSSRLA